MQEEKQSGSKPYIIAFANSAGAARKEANNPKALGEFLASALNDVGEVIAIGLSEILISDDSKAAINDLEAVESGFGKKVTKRFFFPHLFSEKHRHEDALMAKWKGKEASARIAKEVAKGREIQQGTAGLIYKKLRDINAQLIRPAGHFPFENTKNPEFAYQGNRDTEPRSLILFKGIELNDLTLDVAFCQLETQTNEQRIATRKVLNNSPATRNRAIQIDKIAEILQEQNTGNPLVLMGDFNCRPGASELFKLGSIYNFKQVFPESTPLTSSYRRNKISKYSTLKRSAKIIDPTISEKEQGWPYSHLGHDILIDHAYVRGFDFSRWDFQLTVLPLPNEKEDGRISDHRPIALSIFAKGRKLNKQQ